MTGLLYGLVTRDIFITVCLALPNIHPSIDPFFKVLDESIGDMLHSISSEMITIKEDMLHSISSEMITHQRLLPEVRLTSE